VYVVQDIPPPGTYEVHESHAKTQGTREAYGELFLVWQDCVPCNGFVHPHIHTNYECDTLQAGSVTTRHRGIIHSGRHHLALLHPGTYY